MTPDELSRLYPDDLGLLAKALMLKALHELMLSVGIGFVPHGPCMSDVADELERRILKRAPSNPDELPTDELPF